MTISQIVRCTAPEGIDLALAEMWALSKVQYRARIFTSKMLNKLQHHQNVLRFHGAYLESDGEFTFLKHGDKTNAPYRRLIEVL